jgi:putative two-component system response regulator
MPPIHLVRSIDGGLTTVLVAAAQEQDRHAAQQLFHRAGYQVLEAHDGHAALVTAVADQPELILLDRDLQAPSGFEVLEELRLRGDMIAVPIIVVVPAPGGVEASVAAFDAGATDCIARPYADAELLARVRAALRVGRAHQRREDVDAVLMALANAVEAKDPTTEHHCDRLEGLALDLAQHVGMSDDQIEAIRYGAVLHDVGKIGVPEALLRKPGPLSSGEWLEMQRHPIIGASIVAPLRLGRLVAPIVRAHHERWDGSGYPDGLRHEQIPLGARIVTVVDAFDAMVHDRPYRAGRAWEDALEELARFQGTQFDPELVDLFTARARHRVSLGDQLAAAADVTAERP